jgi:hypothetical protein
MQVERFFHELPVERLARDLIGREVTLEWLLVDNSPEESKVSEELYLEYHPSREPSPEEVRDFAAIQYTALLRVWNRGAAGIAEHPGVGPEDIFTPALRLATFTTTLTGITLTHVQRFYGAPLKLVQLENSAGIALFVPLHPWPHHRDREPLAMTLVTNPETHRCEYTIRLYNLALVISVPAD